VTYEAIMRAIREALADCDRYDAQQTPERAVRKREAQKRGDEATDPSPTR
jgi:hypothetical protein